MSIMVANVRERRRYPGAAGWQAALFLTILFLSIPFAVLRVTAQELTAREDTALKAAVSRVAESVVRIETIGGQERVGEFRSGATATTGLVISADGYLVSSGFGFLQQPNAIVVRLADGTTHAAEIVARDRSRMLVLLKLKGVENLPVPEFVSRDEVRVGQWTIAVGRTFSADQTSLSAGIVSATNRIWGRAIQTDANISPANYGGPLIDIQGRVLGLLVPLSPDHQHELAGTEWYDSGIGFAVPLTDVLPHFEEWKSGEDLRPGLLGVTLKGRNIYADPAIIATIAANSPAAEAGLKVGDEIVEVAGMEITRQAQLKHALGPLYAGETVKIVALRGDVEVPVEVKLAATIDAFEHPFLGILPIRNAMDVAGVPVRYIYPDSPAAKGGLVAGDILTGLDEVPIPTLSAWQDAIAVRKPGDQVLVRYTRGDATPRQTTVTLGKLPDSIPESSLPSSGHVPAVDAAGEPELRTLKVPEQPNECLALVPQATTSAAAPALIVVLGNPGKMDADTFRSEWQTIAQTQDAIVLSPQPQDTQRWQPTEMEFIRKIVDQTMKDYDVDTSRVAIFGYQAGGALAYRFTMRNRDVVRAIATVDTAMPVGLELRANDPVDRLAFYVAYGSESPLVPEIQENIQQLRDHKFPVIEHRWEGPSRELTATERDDLARWIDTLDRL